MSAADVEVFLGALGRRVRLARLKRELTQEQLARGSGISRSFVSLIEKGTHGVDVTRLYRLAVALRLPLVELLADPSPSPSDQRSRSIDMVAWDLREGDVLLDGRRVIAVNRDAVARTVGVMIEPTRTAYAADDLVSVARLAPAR